LITKNATRDASTPELAGKDILATSISTTAIRALGTVSQENSRSINELLLRDLDEFRDGRKPDVA
jgi:hypothetical protein